MAITVISYPTAVLGRALRDGEHAGQAAVFYTVVLGLTAAVFTVIWGYLAAHPLLLDPAVRPRVGRAVRRSMVGPGLYAVALLVALVSAPAALVVTALVAGFFALPPRWTGGSS